jgi:hypothetical protein
VSDVFYSPVEFGKLASTPTGDLPASDQLSLYAMTDGRMYTVNSAGVENVLTNSVVQGLLAADVAMGIASTGYNGPAVTLGVGTWLVMAQALFASSSASKDSVSVRLWDLTTAGTIAQAQAGFAAADSVGAGKFVASVSMQGVVAVATGTLDVTLTGYATDVATMKQYPTIDGVSTVANAAVTKITALRIF